MDEQVALKIMMQIEIDHGADRKKFHEEVDKLMIDFIRQNGGYKLADAIETPRIKVKFNYS